MKIYTKEEWAREQYNGRWEASPFNLDRVELGELHPYYIGRRNVMVGGDHGCTLLTEGINFLVEGEYDQLPVLDKSNAKVGACYQVSGGFIRLTEIIRYTEEEAHERGLFYLDHVKYVLHAKTYGVVRGGCAIPGGDTVQTFVLND